MDEIIELRDVGKELENLTDPLVELLYPKRAAVFFSVLLKIGLSQTTRSLEK